MIRCFGGPCGPAKPSILDEITSNILEVMFTALCQNLALIITLVEHISNIVDGRTPPPPRHATSAKPPGATMLPYLKWTSGWVDSGGPSGSPQGEENDSSWPSTGVPQNPNPINSQEVSGETHATTEPSVMLKLGRKARKTLATKTINAAVPGAAPPLTDGHIPLHHT